MHKFLREGRKLICRKCGAEHPTLDTVIACYDSHPEKQARPQTAADDEKFFRDGARYVCRRCQKKWFTRAEAVACYDGHGDQVELAAETPASPASAQASPSTASPSAPTPTRSGSADDDAKFYRDGAKYVCRSCGKKVFTRADVIACFDGHAGAPAEAAEAPVETPASPPAPAPTPTRSGSADDDAKFYRDGAKYVCRSCGKKVFTRADVIACFDGHAGAPAAAVEVPVEAPASPSPPTPTPSGSADDDAKFYRDGAKYVCRKCNKKVFTRLDVIACFDGHA